MRFTNLRLIGFKSFVDTTDLDVREGLTGIVGPNGCGKSNLLEALRWVMGATSAKALRSSGMSDVVFAGTSMRPARNWAEVVLTLDNSDRSAPAEYNDCAVLEISRRIIKNADGAQSIYRINSKEVRAKDVQLLFADASSGANSPALVRQGQISELINAKPENRRRLLEEAAGITGLHSRRHEAELRLRAAEQNLARLEDVTGELEAQKTALARQARQATRYRNLSGDIRRTSAGVAYLKWIEATSQRDAAANDADESSLLVEDTARAAAAALIAREEAEAAIAPLREEEAQSSAALHRLTIERDNLSAEAERANATLNRLRQDAQSAESDLKRERELHEDALQSLEAIDREVEGLSVRDGSEQGRLEEAEAKHREAAEILATTEAEFERTRSLVAETEAERRALSAAIETASASIQRLEGQATKARDEKASLEQVFADLNATGGNLDAIRVAEATLLETEEALAEAERAATAARADVNNARQPKDAARAQVSTLTAEKTGLEKVLGTGNAESFPAVLEAVRADEGYEKALAAALGDDLDAALDPDAPAYWTEQTLREGAPPLPFGVQPLSDFVVAPAALAARLKTVGVVSSQSDIDRILMDGLAVGQRVVSRDGALWRWDGFRKRADARAASAVRLEQRNRLEKLVAELASADEAARGADAAYMSAVEALREAEARENTAKASAANARRDLDTARKESITAERESARLVERLSAINDLIDRASDDKIDLEGRARQLRDDLEKLPNADALQTELSTRRDELSSARAAEGERRAEHRDLVRDAEARQTRRQDLAREAEVWRTRAEGAAERDKSLQERLRHNAEEQAAAENAPLQIESKRKALADKLSDAEATRAKAADALAQAEEFNRQQQSLARSAEAEAATAREARARIMAQLESAEEKVSEAISYAQETSGCAPDGLIAIAEFKDGVPLPTRDELERKLDRYKRERENLGGVNLRADEELLEIDQRLEAIASDTEDCEAAIRKLRHGIGSINKEARERLNAAFETVNTNFTRLFTKLFNGGQAELRLTESEDVLEAGLEIYASPPGKKLTSMSLMSGGEQALTATALIFAVFMSNPAPVCVLDEVDAPLDDANTERFCQLLHQMASETKTRFLVITHHALTMSRMDRLFGVTMMEQGVSRLVSVDLNRAERLIAAE